MSAACTLFFCFVYAVLWECGSNLNVLLDVQYKICCPKQNFQNSATLCSLTVTKVVFWTKETVSSFSQTFSTLPNTSCWNNFYQIFLSNFYKNCSSGPPTFRKHKILPRHIITSSYCSLILIWTLCDYFEKWPKSAILSQFYAT